MAETILLSLRRRLLAVGALSMTGVALLVGQVPSEKRVISPPGMSLVGPYSPGILAGDFLYVSGQGGRDDSGTLPDAIDAEVRQTLRNVQRIVEAGGLTLAHVVYTQVYLTDLAHLEVVERVWPEFFPSAPPARAVLGVHRLPTDIRVEINAVAYRDLSRKEPVIPAGITPAPTWSPGMRAGTRLFLSGSSGVDRATGQPAGDVDAQVQVALDGMRRTLEAAGLDFRHVVFVNPYLTDRASRQMNAIYAKHFEFGNTPARATISVTGLPGGSTIQFTGVAVTDLALRQSFRPRNMRPSATASPCVLADDTYYCSAKSPFMPGPLEGPPGLQGIWTGPIEGQVRQVWRNLIDGLEEADLTLEHVVATNVYLDDMDDFPRMNRIYGQYFGDAPPTRTTVSQVAPVDRAARADGTYPSLLQISLVAVK